MFESWKGKKLIQLTMAEDYRGLRRLFRFFRPCPDWKEGGTGALHIAAGKGNPRLVHLLLGYGTDPDLTDDKGRTPLHHAARASSLVVADMLRRHGADINSRDHLGYTPLHHLIASRPDCEKVIAFCSMGANMNIGDNRGRTPIFYASETDQDEVLAILMLGVANVDAKDQSGWTGLHVAAWDDCPRAADILICQGADLNRKTPDGHTPLDLADPHSKVERVLIDHQKKPGH
jgi:ankyrin repeat protein